MNGLFYKFKPTVAVVEATVAYTKKDEEEPCVHQDASYCVEEEWFSYRVKDIKMVDVESDTEPVHVPEVIEEVHEPVYTNEVLPEEVYHVYVSSHGTVRLDETKETFDETKLILLPDEFDIDENEYLTSIKDEDLTDALLALMLI